MNIKPSALNGARVRGHPALNIEEELHAEEAANAVVTKEIDSFFQKNIYNVGVLPVSLAACVFGSDENVGSSREVEAIIEYIVGKRSTWSSNSSEVKEFRRLTEESFNEEWAEFRVVNPGATESEAMRQLPEKFLLPLIPKIQLDALMQACDHSREPSKQAAVTLRLWYLALSGSMCVKEKVFTFWTTADEAISEGMNDVLSAPDAQAPKGGAEAFYVLRQKGKNEYIYGADILINFRCIRTSVIEQKSIDVVLESFGSSVLWAPLFRPSYMSRARPNRQHKELTGRSNASMGSLWDVREKLCIRVVGGLESITLSEEQRQEGNFRDIDDVYCSIVAEAYFGRTRCCAPQMTTWKLREQFVEPDQQVPLPRTIWTGDDGVVVFDIPVSHVPREVKLCFTLIASPAEKYASVCALDASELFTLLEDGARKPDEQGGGAVFCLGVATVQLFDSAARMRTGVANVRLWNSDTRANPAGYAGGKANDRVCTFHVSFPSFAKPLVFPSGRPPRWLRDEAKYAFAAKERALTQVFAESEIEQLRQLKRILKFDPLTNLSSDDAVILWKYREALVNQPGAMAKFLRSVDWMQPFAAYEARCIIKRWATLAPFDALELLDARYADTIVREQALRFLEVMSDHDLRGCILQLVQVLKYEPYHYSALARFLLRRTFQSYHVIGHYVFWYLAAEVRNPNVRERHGLLLEEILKRSPLRGKLLRQVYVSRELLQCALRVQRAPRKDRIKCLRESLALVRFPQHFTLALNPVMKCSSLVVSQCKVMDSKKFPLWLVFRNHLDPQDLYHVIFKSGDDLRQDLLTLQMLSLMDNLWKANGLDLRIIPYGCISTGEGVGMIEVVLSSDTVANITRKDGGAQAAFTEEPLFNWLRVYNRERPDVERCMWNFVSSVAGYTVATYVLGIGDRHNDNIMLRQDGTLFHIDFGHFLGNFKTKFGFKRETTPFIFTPMYLYMMGGASSPIFRYFTDVACRAYNVIRRNSNALIMLFMLMLSTGIPELQTEEDIDWLRTVLLIDRSDEEASEHYKGLISIALANIRTLINDYIHILAH